MSMKAIVYTKFGPPEVLHLEDVKKPVLVEEKVLVKVHAASINAGDYFWLGGMRATTFCIGPDAFIGRTNNNSGEVFL
jgi:NADPH:quinone reductase-like Zn-dependent oxidoreductase